MIAPAPSPIDASVADLFAPPVEVAAHPAVAAATRISDDVLAPHAAAADDPARGVEPAHLATLAGAGLLSVTVPEAEGGLGAGAGVDAECTELVAAACAATWFVVNQHRSAQQLSGGGLPGLDPAALEIGPAAARYRAGLASARTRAGIAIAHLRRPGPPAVRADPRPDGSWRIDGTADWCTGWGLTDVVMIAATAPGDRYVFVLVPAAEAPGLRAGAPLPLSVMGGTRTVALELDGFVAGPGAVLAVADGGPYRDLDAARTANVTPASLGLLRRVLVGLEAVGRERDRPEAVELAWSLGEHAAARRAEAYALVSDVPGTERIPERIALRAELTTLTVRAASALIAARSGSAMLLDSPEQRWAREAGFHLIQAQTGPVRAAQLTAFGF